MKKYQNNNNNNKSELLGPHIYDIAANAFNALLERNKSQSILISGDSGSGKTECTKKCLQFIAALIENRQKEQMSGLSHNNNNNNDGKASLTSIEQKLIQTNPILEAFGNAKTVKNDNSSRFGKYIEIYFDENNNFSIIGAKNTNYLLETTRVVKCGESERNYHIFYQLIKSAINDVNLQENYCLQNCTCDDFNYLCGVSNLYDNDSNNNNNNNKDEKFDVDPDCQEFNLLQKAMDKVGIDKQEREEIYQIIGGILWLGNIVFDDCTNNNNNASKINESQDSTKALSNACKLLRLDINRDKVEQALTTRLWKPGNRPEVTVIQLTANEARDNRDSLAKVLYDVLFNWLVQRLNVSLLSDSGFSNAKTHELRKKFKHIGILDIYGFEDFKEKNSFEQLCINFTNEKLQQHFTKKILKDEQQTYKDEEIDIKHIEFEDNQAVLDLLVDGKTGIFDLLDQTTMLAMKQKEIKASKQDESFFELSKQQHYDSKRKKKKFDPNHTKALHFKISHFAGPVTYNVNGFVEKNKNSVNESLLQLISQSQLNIIKQLFGEVEKKSKSKSTLSGEFRKSLGSSSQDKDKDKNKDKNSLMQTLSDTESHYIRCVKPNSEKKSDKFEGQLVLDQLQNSGVFDVIKIRKSGFDHYKFDDFVTRYQILNTAHSYDDGDGDNLQQQQQVPLIERVKKLVNELKKQNCDEKHDHEDSKECKFGQSIQIGKTRVFCRPKQHEILEQQRKVAINKTMIFCQVMYPFLHL